jgi:hypothetical protein
MLADLRKAPLIMPFRVFGWRIVFGPAPPERAPDAKLGHVDEPIQA